MPTNNMLVLPEEILIKIFKFSVFTFKTKRTFHKDEPLSKYYTGNKHPGGKVPDYKQVCKLLILNKRFLKLLGPELFPKKFHVTIPLVSNTYVNQFKTFTNFVDCTTAIFDNDFESFLDTYQSLKTITSEESIRVLKADQLHKHLILEDCKRVWKNRNSGAYEILRCIPKNFKWCDDLETFIFRGFDQTSLIRFCLLVMNNENSIMKQFIESFSVDLMFLDQYQTGRINDDSLLGQILKVYLKPGDPDLKSVQPPGFKIFSNFFANLEDAVLFDADDEEEEEEQEEEEEESSDSTEPNHILDHVQPQDINIEEETDSAKLQDDENNEVSQPPQPITRRPQPTTRRPPLEVQPFFPPNNIVNHDDDDHHDDLILIRTLKTLLRKSYHRHYRTYIEDNDWMFYKQRILWTCFAKFLENGQREKLSKFTTKSEILKSLTSVFQDFELLDGFNISRRINIGNVWRVDRFDEAQITCGQICDDLIRYSRIFSPKIYESCHAKSSTYVSLNEVSILIEELVKACTIFSNDDINTSFLAFSVKGQNHVKGEAFEYIRPKMIVINKPAKFKNI